MVLVFLRIRVFLALPSFFSGDSLLGLLRIAMVMKGRDVRGNMLVFKTKTWVKNEESKVNR